MLRASYSIGMPLAIGYGSAEKQEATYSPYVHMDAKLHGDSSDIAHDDRERVLETDL